MCCFNKANLSAVLLVHKRIIVLLCQNEPQKVETAETSAAAALWTPQIWIWRVTWCRPATSRFRCIQNVYDNEDFRVVYGQVMVVWIVTPCSLVVLYRCFNQSCYLPLQVIASEGDEIVISWSDWQWYWYHMLLYIHAVTSVNEIRNYRRLVLCYATYWHVTSPRLCKFAFGHVSDDSRHLVAMEGCAWTESTVSHVIAPTRATKASCVRTTSMTAKSPHAPTALSVTTVLRTTVAVAMKAMQVCNRYLWGNAPFIKCGLFLLWFPYASWLSQDVLAGAGSRAQGSSETTLSMWYVIAMRTHLSSSVLFRFCCITPALARPPLYSLSFRLRCPEDGGRQFVPKRCCLWIHIPLYYIVQPSCVPLYMHETVCGPLGVSPWNLVLVNWLKLFDTCRVSLKYGVMNIFDVKDVLNNIWKN